MTPRERLLVVLALVTLFMVPVVMPLATPLAVTPAWSSNYTGGAMVARGMAADLYDLQQQQHLWEVLGLPGREMLPYIAPPYVALALAAFSPLSYPASAFVWALISLGLAAAVLHAVSRDIARLAPVSPFRLNLAVLLFVPFTVAAIALQNSFILVLAVLMSRRAFRDNRDGRAGLWLSLFWLKPHLLIVPLVVLAVKRRSRALAPVLGIGVVLGLVSWGMMGAGGLRSYADLLAARGGWVYNPDIRWPQMTASLAGLLQILLVTASPDLSALAQALWAAGSLAALAITLHAWRGPWAPGSFRFDLQWALLFVVTILTTLHGYAYEMVLLVPPFAVLYARLSGHGERTVVGGPGRWLTPESIRACLVLVPACSVMAYLTGFPPLPLLVAAGAVVLAGAIEAAGRSHDESPLAKG